MANLNLKQLSELYAPVTDALRQKLLEIKDGKGWRVFDDYPNWPGSYALASDIYNGRQKFTKREVYMAVGLEPPRILYFVLGKGASVFGETGYLDREIVEVEGVQIVILEGLREHDVGPGAMKELARRYPPVECSEPHCAGKFHPLPATRKRCWSCMQATPAARRHAAKAGISCGEVAEAMGVERVMVVDVKAYIMKGREESNG